MAKKSDSLDNPLFPRTPEELLVDVLFASIGDGAIATDEFGTIVRVNAAALEILGYQENEIVGKWFPSRVILLNEDGSVLNPLDRPITQAFLTGHTVAEKAYYRHKDGQKIPVSITVSPILLKNKPIGAINLFRDITQEYEVDRMKSEFISLASHQLRTPISSIKTYAHMIAEGYMGDLNPQQQNALHSIITSADRMNQLTNTLLNITRIESGFVNIIEKMVNIPMLIQKALKEHYLEASRKNIELTFNKPKKHISIFTDTFITEEIVNNLFSNAIKYTPDGGKVTAKVKQTKTQVIFSVSDTGIGIPKQVQHQIFSKFFRAPNVISHDTTGTGLGLYLVRGLAEQIGAAVWFKSKVGEGSTFYLALPLKPSLKRAPEGQKPQQVV